jgi:flagellar hook-length control protein FliK
LQASQNTAQTMTATHFTSWMSTQENAIVNQVMQRFHINPNSPSSKIVVKLYPEELGELKIDVQMKDGALKANIVTQTQQAQQALEKYIPKLKSFMEQQGLTVDDILVTNNSDDVGGHELFQEDFVDNNDFTPPGKSFKTASFPDLTFDNVFSDNTEGNSGVNVTV